MTKKRILKVLFLYLFLKHSRGRDVFGCWQWAIWSQKKYIRYVRPKKTNQKVRCLEMIRFTSSLRSPVNEKGALNLIYGKVENLRYRISGNSCRGNYSFLNLEIQSSQYIRPKVTVHKCVETIQGRKLYEEKRYVES